MSLSTNDVVTVTVQTAAAAPQARGFSTGMILGKSTVLPLSSRTRLYNGITAVGVDFSVGTEEYKAASIHFQQKPKPSKVKIGRQFLTAQAGQLLGGSIVATPIGTFNAVTNGGFDISINGTNHQITALDLSGAGSLAAVAADVQTKLAAALASTTCTFDGTRLIVTSPTTGASSVVSPAVAPSGGGVDISGLLGLSVAAGAFGYVGVAVESLTDALNNSAIFDPNFYGITLAGGSIQDKKDAMAWAEAGIYLHGFTETDPASQTTADTSDLLSYAKTNGYQNSFGLYSSGAYAGASLLSRMLVVDLTQPNSSTDAKFRQLPGIAPDNVSETQAAALRSKNGNFYTTYAAPGTDDGFAMVAEGTCGDGSWIDQVFGLAFMQANLQNAYFTTLATAVTKIQLTDNGVQRIVKALKKVMQMGVTAGLFAPGIWNGDDLGQVANGDFLKTGYYIFAAPVASMLQADRNARKAPPISIIACGAGAIHSGVVTFIFQQ